jgi:exopolysaccharide biosynthesis polyprenyl glycosylphosphotransferase
MAAAACAAELIRRTLGHPTGTGGGAYLMAGAAMALAWLAVLSVLGAYEHRCLGSGSEEYRRVLSSAARLLSIMAILALLLDLDIARAFVAIAIPTATALTLLERYLVRRWLHHQRAKGRFLRQVIVVGTQAPVRDLVGLIKQVPHAGLAVLGVCLSDHSGESFEVEGELLPVLGRPADVLTLVQASRPDAVVIADRSGVDVDVLRQLAWELEGSGMSLLLAPEVTDVAGPLLATRPVSGLPVLAVDEPRLGSARHILKEAFDRTFAALSLLLLAPGLVLIGITIRLTSPGPAIFRQVRVGLRGRPFVLLKFRTMTVDAEERRANLLALNEHDGVLFKIRNDPRITRLGRFLRRWSIDELPQLWNVARGQMSFVGPRPPLPCEVENYSHRVRRRLLVKPGLTGLWQISGRSGLSWEEAVRLDLHYVEHWSPSLDMAILAKTLSAVVRGHGAY